MSGLSKDVQRLAELRFENVELKREVERLREALATATSYTLNLDADPAEWVTVELTCVAGGGPHKPPHDTWAIRLRSYCLDVDGDWIYEPIPSSRDDEFFARTRWTLNEAMDRARAALKGNEDK